MPECDLNQANRIAESIRSKTEGLIIHFSGNPLSVTISLGVSAMSDNDTPEELINRADKALYTAKKTVETKYKAYKLYSEIMVSTS